LADEIEKVKDMFMKELKELSSRNSTLENVSDLAFSSILRRESFTVHGVLQIFTMQCSHLKGLLRELIDNSEMIAVTIFL